MTTLTTHTDSNSGKNQADSLTTQATSLVCLQNSLLSEYEAGRYDARQGQSLSCFVFTASFNSYAAQTLTRASSNTAAGTDGSQNTYAGGGTSSLSQVTVQSQGGSLQEAGTYRNGAYLLPLVSLTYSESTSSTYKQQSNDSYAGAGAYAGNDSTSVTANAQSGFGVQLYGSYGTIANGTSWQPAWTSLSLSFAGSASGNYDAERTGLAGTMAYSHSDVLSESQGVAAQANLQPDGWHFSRYDATSQSSENASDTVGSDTGVTQLSSQMTVAINSGGTVAVGSESDTGNATILGRGYSYSYTQAKSLPQPGPSVPLPVQPNPWGGAAGALVLLPDAGLAGISSALASQSAGGLALRASLPGPELLGMGVGAMPQPQRPAPPAAWGNWLGPLYSVNAQWLGMQPSQPPWSSLDQMRQYGEGTFYKSAADVQVKLAQGTGSGVQLYSATLWQQQVASLPNGVSVSYDFWAVLGVVEDYVAGVLDGMTQGRFSQVRQWLNSTGWVYWGVDTQSQAYQIGTYTGQAVIVVLSLYPPTGRYVMLLQSVLATWNAYDAYQAGDYKGVAQQLTLAALYAVVSRGMGSSGGAGAAGGASGGGALTGRIGSLGGGANSLGRSAQFWSGGASSLGRGVQYLGGSVSRAGGAVSSGIGNGGSWLAAVGGAAMGNPYVRDALIGAGVNTVGYVVSTGVSSLLNWENQYSLGGLAGAIAGGAAAGATFRLMVNQGWAGNPIAMGAATGGVGGLVGGGVTNFVDQWQQNGLGGISLSQVVQSAAIGGGLGAFGGAIAGWIIGANPSAVRILLGSAAGGIAAGMAGGGLGAFMNGQSVGWGMFVGGLSGGSGGLAGGGAFVGGRAFVNRWNAPRTVRGSTADFELFVQENKGIIANLDKNGLVEFKINTEGSGVRGTDLFNRMMAHFGNNAKGVWGKWVSGTNLNTVNKLTSQGVPLQEAVSRTWTANRAREAGFGTATIIKAEGSPGAYTNIEVTFTR